MKIKIDFLNKNIFEEKLKHLKDIDFSLFVECVPQTQDELSSINIITLYEPNEYFGRHDWVIQNKHLFDIILTWDDKILNTCDNALFLPFGHTWFTPDQYTKNHAKEFKIAHLRGNLLKSYGHQMRWEILERKNEIKVPTKFFDVYGDRHNIEQARFDKEEIFGDSQFGVAIENFAHRGWFSEKILDCFLLKTIPIYWGCSNIGDFFNEKGIIKFGEADEFIYIANQLTDSYYDSQKDIIEENYQLALQYVNYEQNIINKVIEIFKFNNLT
jgi:hypothetical protein